MSIRFFRNPYKKALQETAKLIVPREETAQKILGSVMLAAGVTSAVSFASASAKAVSLGRVAALKVAGSVVAVTACTSIAGLTLFSPPAIEDIHTAGESWSQSSIVVTTGRSANIRSVLIIPEQGEPFSAEQDGSAMYTADVYCNGLYTVEVTGQSGQTVTGQVQINCIDTQIPEMVRYSVDSESVTIYFTDDKSGVNWDSITAKDSAGREVPPLEINADQGYVKFELPKANLDISLEDMAGNKGITTVYVN